MDETTMIRFLSGVHRYDPHTAAMFGRMSEGARRSYVHAVAVQTLKESSALASLPIGDKALASMSAEEAVIAACECYSDPALDDVSVMREAGVPLVASRGFASMRESSHDEVLSRLDDALPDGHPDRDKVRTLKQHGSALTAEQRLDIDQLANRHADLLDDNSSDTQPISESDATRPFLAAMREVQAASEPGDHPRAGTMDAFQALASSGVPLRSGA